MPWTEWTLVPVGVVGKTTHYWGLPPEVAPDSPRQDMPPARVLLIEKSEPNAGIRAQMDELLQDFLLIASEMGEKVTVEEGEAEGVNLIRYSEDGVFAGDTYHDDPQAAKKAADSEYDSTMDWHDVPSHLKNASIDENSIKDLLKSLPN